MVANSNNGKGLGGRMSVLNIIKHRYGQVALVFPLLFIGEIGLYSDLPSAKELDYGILEQINSLKYEGEDKKG